MEEPNFVPVTGNNKSPKKKRKRRGREKLDNDAKIAIIGSGLAGLSVAISLEKVGFTNIHIYERDLSLSIQKEGYGLTLTYNPKGPLGDSKGLGLLEKVAKQDCPSRSHYVFKPDGTILGYFGNEFYKYRGLGQRGNLRVPRIVLRRMLVDTLQTTKIHWGYRFINPIQTTWKKNENYVSSSSSSSSSVVDKDNGTDGGDEKYTIEFEKINNEENKKYTTTKTIIIENVTADLIVAADGIRSSVLGKLVYKQQQKQTQQNHHNTNLPRELNIFDNNTTTTTTTNQSSSTTTANNNNTTTGRSSLGLRRMGVRLILGIADFTHPLLNERGFYTLDGKHRLFTMPYESNRFNNNTYYAVDSCCRDDDDDDDDDNHSNGKDRSSTSMYKKKNRIMWQLSFATTTSSDDDDDVEISFLDKDDLQSYVLESCRSWHNPVLKMIQATPIETIWGTDLMDRDPKEVLSLVQKQRIRRLVVVGDALHSMSPFKGQGANQALTDGPLLAKWLSGSAVDSALVGFWRETVQRTAPVVTASRQAAKELHSSAAISSSSSHGFAGIQPDKADEFLSLLQNRKIGANLEGDLDKTIAEILAEFPQMAVQDEQEPISLESQIKALNFAAVGDTQGLRILSLAKQSRSIRSAKDQNSKKTCLHLAMESGHIETCKWLLTEVGCDPQVVDQDGKTCLDYATTQSARSLLAKFR